MRLTLPLPPTGNHYREMGRKGGKVRFWRSKATEVFREAVRRVAGPLRPFNGAVVMTVHVYRKRKAGDVDAYHKCLLDALQGVAYVNDRQVVELHTYLGHDKENPRLEVELWEVSGPSKQVPNVFKAPYPDLAVFDASAHERPSPPKQLSIAELATPNYRPPPARKR